MVFGLNILLFIRSIELGICNWINQNKSARKSTGMVLLDVEKAFDSIWHDGLIYKMNLFNFPKYILKLIRSFCLHRSFQVSVGNSLSSIKFIPAGVPQGSILSPFLYSIYTADIGRPKHIIPILHYMRMILL